MRNRINLVILAMLSAVYLPLPVMGEGIASLQWLSAENIQTLPRHKITISCAPDPKDPELLNVEMNFKLDPGHKFHGVNFYIGGANAEKSKPGERFSGKLSVEDDTCSFKVSRQSLENIEFGYCVTENDHSVHMFSIMGKELPKLAAFLNSSKKDSATKSTDAAEQASPSDGG